MRFNFQKIHSWKLQINENKFPIKIKKVHQATLFQALNHNTISLMDPKNFINTINTNRMFPSNPNAILLGGKGKDAEQSLHFISAQLHWGAFSKVC